MGAPQRALAGTDGGVAAREGEAADLELEGRGRGGCWKGGAAVDLPSWRWIPGAGGRGSRPPELAWCSWSPPGRRLLRSVRSERPGMYEILGSLQAVETKVEELGWRQIWWALAVELGRRPRRSVWAAQILWVGLCLEFAFLYYVIRVFFTHCILVLDLCSSRIITVYLVTRALGIPSMVFVTPIWPEFSFGAHFLREFMPMGKIRVIFTLCVLVLCRIRFIIPRMVFVTPMWPEFSFGAPFLREFIFPIWYSDTLQEIMLCKRIITVVGRFGPQSLVGDPVLVVYSLGVFCNFNGFVCLFHGTSLFRDLYVLLIELLSAVMDFVQFKD